MREMINKYAYPIAGAAIALAIVLFIVNSRKTRLPTVEDLKESKAFYVDEETGEEVVLSADELPPRMGANGKRTLVRARKYTRDGGKTVTTVYLEKYSDQAIEELKTASDTYKIGLLDRGLFIRLPGKGHEWVPNNSPEAEEIRSTPIPGNGPIIQEVLPPK
ncbi:MAG: hypothetical protein FWD61_08450 [Phycisphaerales bacterium]|nr:hypothetical protein [Phycisphaerales bacterium]